MACKNYDITISPIDIAAATGNIDTFLNGRVFVGYTDCYGNSLTISYNAAGTYNNAFCANDQIKITFIYYRADLGLVATNSFDTQDGICTPTPPLCQCITVVDFGGSTPYQYTDCSGLIISTTSPPNPSVFNICGSNPSTSAPKFIKFTIGETCSDGVNCDIPCLDTCSILFNDFDVIYGYDYTSNISTNLNPYFDIAPIGGSDIAHNITKLWVYDSSMIMEYDITLCPFFATFNRNISLPHPLGSGLAVINDTTLISSYLTNIVQIDISGPSATVTTQFPMPSGRDISGDMVYTYSAPHKLICSYVDNTDTTYITQHDYSTGVVEVDVIVSPTIPTPYGMFMNSGDLYVCNGGGQLYNFGLTPPYNLTYTKTVSNTIGGASQPPICADITIMGPTSTPTPTPTNTPTLTNTQTPTNTQTQTQTPTNTLTPTQTPTNTLTPTQTPSTTPISCGFGLIKTNSEYYYTDCCGNFISGFNNTGDGLQVSFNYNLPRSGVGKLNVPVTTLCLSPTPTPTPTITPTNTATPTITPTNTITPTQSVTPSVTPSNRPVTRLQNDCDVITLFDLGISCNVIQSPTESNPEGGILSVNVTGGTAPYTFTWNGNGGHNQTLFGIPAGSYEVVVTDYAWPDGGPNGVSDYTATTICVLAGPIPTSTPTMTPTPSQTPPVQCVDLCFIAIAPFGIPNVGPIQFVCDGTQNGRFRWTGSRYEIIWNPISSRWEMYQQGSTIPATIGEDGDGIIASTTLDLIPDSAWQVFGGTVDYSITMTRGECPAVIPLQVTVDTTNTSCQDLTICNGSLTILAEDGYPPYSYSIDGGFTYSTDNTYNNLCPNTYLVKVVDSFNNVYSSNVSIGYDSPVTTYQLTFVPGNATITSVPNVSKTIVQPVTLVVTPELPVGVSVTFSLTSTALRTINSPGVANSSVDWQVRKNGEFVIAVVSPTTIVSQGTRPFCSVNDTQLINSTNYTSGPITITNGDVITMTSITTDTITNGQVSSQTNCTTNIKTEIGAVIEGPEITGDNCSSVIAISSPQIVTNELTYVPVTINPCPNCVVQDITIGTQVWSKCNLDVTTYRDGTPIPQVTDPTAWANLTTGAWCYFENNSANGPIYGKLYNWYAVNNTANGGLAPVGYHIPTLAEWTTLTTFLGGDSVAGGKMKETGLCHWVTPNTAATNISNFTGLPGGSRIGGVFGLIGEQGYFWSSTATAYNNTEAEFYFLQSVTALAFNGRGLKSQGNTVRLIKDEVYLPSLFINNQAPGVTATFKIKFSKDNGVTWNEFINNGVGAYPNYSLYSGVYALPGETIYFGLTDMSDNDISYGIGTDRTDFDSLCGLSNPLILSNITSNTASYLNLKVNSGDYVNCYL